METYRAVVTQKDPGSYENIGGAMHLWREDIYLVNEARLPRRTRKPTNKQKQLCPCHTQIIIPDVLST